MGTYRKPTPKIGFGVTTAILILGLLIGLVGEIQPVAAMDLQAGLPPVAKPDFYKSIVIVGPTFTVPAITGVLANDSDPEDGTAVTAVPMSGPTVMGGTIILSADGSFIYTPPIGFTTDSFYYQVIDSTSPQSTSIPAKVVLTKYSYVVEPDRYGFRNGFYRWVYPAQGVLQNDDASFKIGTLYALPTGLSFVVVGPSNGILGPSPIGVTPSYTSGLQGDGSFTYYPNGSKLPDGTTVPGTPPGLGDQFTYYITNGTTQVSEITTVKLTNTLTCTSDSGGVNDEPGQKDLTQFCLDTNVSTQELELAISWSWDIISLGGNNSANACALFDTDDIENGLADYAICMEWKNDIVATSGFPVVYQCNDSRSDRCAGSGTPTTPSGLSCALLQTSDDPFPAGDVFPSDAKSICSVAYGNVFAGISTINFLDVCSFPSGEPGSDPSDCVRRPPARSGNAVLKVIKNVEPNNPDVVTGWDISIENPPAGLTNPVDTLIGDDATTSYVLPAGTYTITESLKFPTNIGSFTSTYRCKNILLASVVYDPPLDQSAGPGMSISRAVAEGDIWECTFTNSFPTAVSLLNFEAKDIPGGVLLTWETATETYNLGFNLFRATSPDGERSIPLNDKLIPTLVYPGATFGAVYTYLDPDVVPGVTYYYWLQDVSTNLDQNVNSNLPEVSITALFRQFIPLISIR